jgi:hypothetical protein
MGRTAQKVHRDLIILSSLCDAAAATLPDSRQWSFFGPLPALVPFRDFRITL